ncbi:CDP-alcohol phosphatidyltransferase family protein [Kineosporia sp. R_H_3]|uniref:CDP-alcohol phosphatidyltransferase family protein n=1 Tax=Kineosporia sp. R_H_3 TaxID=1961848 RepID=UPI0018EA22F9|nr:CDP-alcohol phosphatidyltransferase family protein [Kineosporia sp. R_H_3]
MTTHGLVHDPTDNHPDMATLRAVCQPPETLGRRNAEHWAGPLYLRRGSIHVTRLLLPTNISANGVTWLMVVVGLAGAACLLLGGVWGAVLAVLGVQLQILLDCSDGEVARWRQQFSPAGVYLDRIAHYTTEAALPIALGVRADGGLGSIGGWTTVGALLAVLVLLIKAETDLVHVARAFAKRPLVSDDAATTAPRAGLVATLRRAAHSLPFNRAFVAIELTLLVLVAALVDLATGGLDGTQWLVVLLVPAALVTVTGHLASIVLSSRLR